MKRSLFAELRHRNVFRAAAFYIAAVWALAQGISQLGPTFGMPDWGTRWFVIACVIGFPFWIAFAWFYEFTPEGIKRESEVDPAQSIVRHTGRKLDVAIIGVLAIAVVLLVTDRFVLHHGVNEEAAIPIPNKSIAVLPFADLSPTHDQGYFSDGIAEELQSALSRLRDLKVAGRSSAFYYKGRNEDLRAIGRALGVANVLEGSVRQQGNRVRITAQLVRTADDFRVWSDNYDGDLSDVFALQERIARAITDKLEVTLQEDEAKSLVPVATGSPEAYSLYLHASGVFNRREGAHFPEAIAELERALQLDPSFARAHARLASLLSVASNYANIDFSRSIAGVEEHARRASELDPKLAEPHAALGQSFQRQRRFVDSREAFERALSLEPADETAMFWHAGTLVTLGYVKQGTQLLDRVLTIDPLLPVALQWRGLLYAYNGDIGNAERLLQRSADVKLAFAGLGLSLVAASRGQADEAANQLASGFKPVQLDMSDDELHVLARGISSDATARAATLAMIDEYLHRQKTSNGVIAYVLIRLGEPARALAITREQASQNDSTYQVLLWTPYGLQARLLPQFSEYVRKVGFAAVWDRYGEPDYCRKQASGEYECE